jgi:hypothetical protein
MLGSPMAATASADSFSIATAVVRPTWKATASAPAALDHNRLSFWPSPWSAMRSRTVLGEIAGGAAHPDSFRSPALGSAPSTSPPSTSVNCGGHFLGGYRRRSAHHRLVWLATLNGAGNSEAIARPNLLLAPTSLRKTNSVPALRPGRRVSYNKSGCGEAQPPIPTFAGGGHLRCDRPQLGRLGE